MGAGETVVRTELICHGPASRGMVQVDHKGVTFSEGVWQLGGGSFMTRTWEQGPRGRSVLKTELRGLSLAKISVLGGRRWPGVNERNCQLVVVAV